MCAICGCDDHHEHVHADGTRHSHSHAHDEHHEHDHRHIDLEARILAKNDGLADANASWFASRRVLAVNLMGAPGSGKTSLLQATIARFEARSISVIEGDQSTSNDADRIRAAGAAVVQVNTGTGCHLDAAMVARSVRELEPPPGSIVVIENVGNLVCPALFRLGEQRRVVVLSVAEGDDKPLKYPHMFNAADLVLLNKIDLVPYVDFSVDRAIDNVRAINPAALVLRLSAKTGDGMQAWSGWLQDQLKGLGDGRQGRVERPVHAFRVER